MAAVAVGALVLAGTGAFTAANTGLSSNVVGYGPVNASGANVTDVSYTLDGNDPSSVTAVTVTTQGDTSLSSAGIGFNGTGTMDTAQGSCTGTFSAGRPGHTTYNCTLTSAGLVSSITSTDIVVARGA
jgi:hypothetical protein